jgi:DNA-directed RNA polymerase specialized sigma24 family protein
MTIVAPSQQADTVLARDYERLKPDILRTVRGKLASSGVQFDDLDLDAFYNQAWHGVHTKLAEGERVENVSGLLVTIAQRRALDEFRALRMEARVDADLLDGQRVDLDLAAAVDDHMRLRYFIEGMREKLQGREREAAALCYVQDYSRPEAAQAMGIKPRRMEKLMDGVSKKVGAFVGDIQRDEWCDARHSMIKAYALGLLDPDGERYALAAEHLESCSACRRDVIRMRGIASLSPPVPLMMAALVGAGATGAGGGGGFWLFHGGGMGAKVGTVAAAAGTAVAGTVAVVALTGSPKSEPPLPTPTPTPKATIVAATPVPLTTTTPANASKPAKKAVKKHKAKKKARKKIQAQVASTPIRMPIPTPVQPASAPVRPAATPKPKPATDGAGEFELR